MGGPAGALVAGVTWVVGGCAWGACGFGGWVQRELGSSRESQHCECRDCKVARGPLSSRW